MYIAVQFKFSCKYPYFQCLWHLSPRDMPAIRVTVLNLLHKPNLILYNHELNTAPMQLRWRYCKNLKAFKHSPKSSETTKLLHKSLKAFCLVGWRCNQTRISFSIVNKYIAEYFVLLCYLSVRRISLTPLIIFRTFTCWLRFHFMLHCVFIIDNTRSCLLVFPYTGKSAWLCTWVKGAQPFTLNLKHKKIPPLTCFFPNTRSHSYICIYSQAETFHKINRMIWSCGTCHNFLLLYLVDCKFTHALTYKTGKEQQKTYVKEVFHVVNFSCNANKIFQ